jgi:hypothetical protein
MHYRVFVIVNELSDILVHGAMRPHEGEHWDWWRPGGRYDGYFEPEDVAKARETQNGFNFEPQCETLEHNHIAVRDWDKLPDNRRSCYAYVEGDEWHECERWVEGKEHAKWEGADGGFVRYPEFEADLAAALARHPEGFVVVVDVHN